jgi:hypothetical protein
LKKTDVFKNDLEDLQQKNRALKIDHERYVRETREAETLLVQLKVQEPELKKQWVDSVAQTENSI